MGERDLEKRKSLLELMEQSELFYDEQFREAKIVANVSDIRPR